MEGPGIAKIENGKLLIHSKYSEATQKYLDTKDQKVNNGTGYYKFVQELVIKDKSEQVEDFQIDGKFAGGHLVLWNKKPTPDNYIIECDFQSLSDYSLHMLMFSHLGINGESVFDSKLKSRTGLAIQYTKSDMVGYRISYFAPDRGTTNLRKSPEKQLLGKGKDFSLIDSKAVHHLKIIKDQNKVTWQIDGKTALEFVEENPKKVLKGGYWAIRLMVPAMGLYDNVRVYALE